MSAHKARRVIDQIRRRSLEYKISYSKLRCVSDSSGIMTFTTMMLSINQNYFVD